jgi:CRP/FNR family cyclic AMP-dependent transcriptional regulator
MTPISVHDVFRRSALLQAARNDTLELLERSSRVRRLDRGAMLIHEGDQPASVFFIAHGLLRSFTTSIDGAEPTLTVLLPGDHVGELGVIDGTARSASVASLRPTTVVEVSGVAFRAALDADVAIYRTLVAQLSQRLRSTSNRLSDLTILDLGARLAKFLLTEMGRGTQTRFLELQFSQSELGQLLGGARQSINQLLSTMERDGLITVDGRTIEVVDPVGLRRRADS